MKVLTLTNPYGPLMFVEYAEAKHFETRSRKWSHRGPLAIHTTASCSGEYRALCTQEPFRSVLAAAGLIERVPLGCIIGVVEVVGCLRSELVAYRPLPALPTFQWREDQFFGVRPGRFELAFGIYDPGRFVYVTRDPRPLKQAIPARGHQGLWDFPDEPILAQLG